MTLFLSGKDIAKMIDLSCVRTFSDIADIDEMVAAARKYDFGQVSVLQWHIPYTKNLLNDRPDIHVVGNVSFPSGSDTTSVKVFQAKEMVTAGCDEIDVVMNIGKLRSGLIDEVEQDVKAVVEAARPLPVKVIIEIMLLKPTEVEAACRICLNSGATFVKTGTGWADRGTTVDDVKLVKSFVGDRIKIKASGGIRDLDGLVAMYQAGARRFGINLKSGIEVVENSLALHEGVEV
jgi:deoxyribose-phosphate aldolase